MGSSGQLYSLSWGEFGSSLTSAVQLLRGHGDLVDVTLAAGGRSFPAHKIVLCAASPFLLDLLKSTPCKHPVVMLAGIGADDLESLLEFVYRGEVSVEPSQLPSLLQAAHCLSIHGLTPPTILTENGEEIPPSAVPTMNESLTRDVLNSYLPLKRKKKRRKSSASGSKWPRLDSQGDNESRTTTETHSDDHRGTTDYVQKEDDAASQTDDALNQNLEHTNHRRRSRSPQQVAQHHLQPGASGEQHPDQLPESEPHLHTLMPMQQYSPLHIPQFPGSLSVGYPPGVPIAIATNTVPPPTTATTTGKIRGASDSPGICPLCGATLRQARNLRRHLLSSCKYRFNGNPMSQSSDAMMIEIKPEVDLGGYDSGSNGCEQIICKPSPLPSPQTSNVVSPHSRNVTSSPTVAR